MTESEIVGTIIKSAGKYYQIIPKLPTTLNQLFKRAGGSVNAVLDKPSIKQILEYS